MNTNQLKKFAQEARRKLLEQVGAKLNFVLTTDSAELREKTEQLKQLRQELGRTSKEQLIEKVAYTWFNRLMALRFMDANDYQPLGIRIITPKDGYTIPELLDEAKRGNIPDELKLNRQKIYDLLDNRIPSKNPQNEAFKELLIGVCNHLHTTFLFLFEKINDYTELLLPDDLTSDFSIVTDVREGMLSEDCQNVEIIGWLYQFYISEEKERLINAKERYQSHEIASVTQLFTPKWIVQYMVDNTLGNYWKEARPHTNLINNLEYYIRTENQNLSISREIETPEKITFFDPCVGSAHILCYAFDVFVKIYEEEGYNSTEIPELIVRNNLFGMDIDDRATQLAGFALMMKGREYDRKFLKKNISPNIIAFQNSDTLSKFKYAKTIGSLLKISNQDYENIIIENNTLYADQQEYLKKQAFFLIQKYDILVTNPPYLNSVYMSPELKNYVEIEYKTTKTDLFACFLQQTTSFTKPKAHIGFICPFVWMFINSYELIRNYILENVTISSLVQLEYNAFEPACVPVCTFTLINYSLNQFKGSYIKLSEFKGFENQAPKTLEAIQNHKCGWFYEVDQENFLGIPQHPIAFWLNNSLLDSFSVGKLISEYGEPRQGMATTDNKRFLRYWKEISYNSIRFNLQSHDEIMKEDKWFPYNKGGEYRKWYGNNDFIVLYENKGAEMLSFIKAKYPRISDPEFVIKNRNTYFKDSITWSYISSTNLGVRNSEHGFIYDVSGSSLFVKSEYKKYILGFLCSRIARLLLDVINPTMNIQAGDIGKLPIIYNLKYSSEIEQIVESSIDISKEDWDMRESSWDFKKNALVKTNSNDSIEVAMHYLQQYWSNKFNKLYQNEIRLNEFFAQIYNVEDTTLTNLSLSDITILKDESEILDNKLVFKNQNLIKQFISYFIGCIFGRYSLDKEGLILANKSETIKDYFQKINRAEGEITFLPDMDNIIPVLKNEWFEDDIVAKFLKFLDTTFGSTNLNKNLAYIEDSLNKNIRDYFLKEFITDHFIFYNKRPIYWMFSSPKGSFNVLIYMHRYTSDTVSNILNKYLKEFIGKLNTRKEHLEHVQVTGSASDKTKAIKEIDNIEKMLVELHGYERDILYPLATERIEINLDDGVLVNYNKFGKAVKELNGLNDPATKKKVKQFDWIDTSQIR